MKSSQALAAQAIRKELKAAFPGTKFKVTSQGYSGGDHVNVSYTDGPKIELVTDITCKYKYGHFDGMTDMYENSNSREDIPQTKYLFVERNHSFERTQKAVDWLNTNTTVKCEINKSCKTPYIEGAYSQEWQEYPSAIIHRMLNGYYTRTNPEMDFSE